MKRSRTGVVLAAVGIAAAIAFASQAYAATVAEFYKGKDVTIIVGSGSGCLAALCWRTF